jgi:ADP-heptose:LPS heptosyltransferase
MHLVTVTEPITGVNRLAVGSYLADNANAGELLARHPESVRIELAPNPAPISALDFTPGGKPKRILVIRAGGFSDLLFLTPVFRHLKADEPSLHIAVACFPEFSAVLEHNPDVAQIVQYPVPLSILETFDAVVPLENTVDTDHEHHTTDRYFLEFGIAAPIVPASDKACRYHLTDKERAGALSFFPTKLDEKGDAIPRLGVQVAASSMCRTYPHDQLAAACQMLHERGWEIFFFGPPKSIAIDERAGLVNLTLRSLNFRQSAAILTTCDVVLAPDSALAQLAGALDLPCVALYGPTPWRLRSAYHPKTIALQGTGPCAPCFHTGRTHYPENGPCAKSGRCDVLASIKPGRLAAKVDALYRASLYLAEHDGRDSTGEG